MHEKEKMMSGLWSPTKEKEKKKNTEREGNERAPHIARFRAKASFDLEL